MKVKRLRLSLVKREQLFARIPPPRTCKYGITDNDILRISVSPELVADLLDCLHSDDELDLIFGLMFAEHLRTRADFCSLAEPSLPALTAAIRSALAHVSSRVRADAVRAFVAFRTSYDDYAAVMRDQLARADPQPRREALAAATTYLAAEDLPARRCRDICHNRLHLRVFTTCAEAARLVEIAFALRFN